jgi:putative hydrolase of the HAD superfamily
MPAPIEAIIFDFFGVLVSYDDQIVADRTAEFCSEPGRARIELFDLPSARDLVAGRLSLQELHALIVSRFGLALDYPAFVELWKQPYSRPMPGMAALIGQLSKRHRLLLLSDVDEDYWDTLRSLHSELNCFDELLLSFELGMRKPDPEVFLHACKTAGAPPMSCFFIDDKAENIEAARYVGLKTHLFRSIGELIAERQHRGML